MTQLTSNGIPLDLSPEAFGDLRDSSNDLGDIVSLRERMAKEGYLYFRQFVNRACIMKARRVALEILAARGLVKQNSPLIEAHAPGGLKIREISPEFGRLPPLKKLAHSGPMIEFYNAFFGGEARSFDVVFTRIMGPGNAEMPHSDIVYMGRGTHNLCTSWVPLGDIPKTHGPLMILESSHLLDSLTKRYWNLDVDRAGLFDNIRFKHGHWVLGGRYSRNPAGVQKEFGLRWLTTDFRAGDMLAFSAYTLHCTLDNVSDRVRLSLDARYQLASEPVDGRWIGENPIAHSQRDFGLPSYLKRVSERIGQLSSLSNKKHRN